VITTPHARFEKVAELLDELGDQAKALEQSASHRAKHHTRLEIARTRVDIYEWVAYDSDHLDDPLKSEAVRKLNEFLKRPPEKEDEEESEGEGLEPVRAVEFVGSPAWDELQEPEVFRAWVLSQAQSVCKEPEKRNLDVEFALAECLFKLGKTKGADNAFESAERALHHEAGEFHEKRRTASIHQSVLICHSRLLKLREKDPNQKEDLSRRVREASQKTIEVVRDMRQGGVTIFSQIQRRNVTQDEFSDEVREIAKQAEE
jgi:hypothetical protein